VPIAALTLLAQDAQEGGIADLLIPLVLVFGIFYLLVIRPASRDRKKREQQVRSLKKHDKVITNAGIHGTIVSFDDETVTLRVDDKNNVRVKFSRAAIWQVNPEPAGGAADASQKTAANAS
jgi:preprotein translocase subunit YajC